jgi:hypothetical protein
MQRLVNGELVEVGDDILGQNVNTGQVTVSTSQCRSCQRGQIGAPC